MAMINKAIFPMFMPFPLPFGHYRAPPLRGSRRFAI
jgi:hypothetical protein